MIALKNSIYSGKTSHCRFLPERHIFHYPLFFLCLKLSELASFHSKLFSYNRIALLSFWDEDYLRNLNGSIETKFKELLRRSGVSTLPKETYLLTLPRFLGYVFNPVSFYISLEDNGRFHSLVAEVSNTFGEVHTYVLNNPLEEIDNTKFTFNFPKEFYVSPFLKTGGMYRLNLEVVDQEITIKIDLEEDNQRIFSASLSGKSEPLSNLTLLKSIFRFPLACVGTMMRIQIQALVLIFRKKVSIFRKPSLSNPNSYTYRLSWLYAGRMWALEKFKTMRIF